MKYRGRVRFTTEVLRAILELPEEIEIINVVYDAEREIVEAVVRSDKQITGLTYPTDEGHCIPSSNSSLAFELIRKAKEMKSDETD